jgi:hypothetical protein
MILKSLQIRLQSPERQFCKGRVNARRFQPRDAAFLFSDHLSRFFVWPMIVLRRSLFVVMSVGPRVKAS